MSNTFLECLLKVSEKAANIARVCRQNEHLFQLLVQEKKSDEKNARFLQDFKTLADVLIQEMVKHDIGQMFPAIANHIKGEESNSFSNTIGETITVSIQATEKCTATLLSQVLDGNSEAALLLAVEVHKDVSLDQVNIGNQTLPTDLEFPIDQFGIWIDPIDSTAEYISGDEVAPICDGVYPSGLKCVTVLIGVFDRSSGTPVIGVVNQPFHAQTDTVWIGQCQWGIKYKTVNLSSITNLSIPEHKTKVVALSASEDPILKAALAEAGYQIVEMSGAGYKLLCVILGYVDVYLLSKGSTFRWDTCAPNAVLRALGGDVLSYCKAASQARSGVLDVETVTVNYMEAEPDSGGVAGWCNRSGIIAYRDEVLAREILKLLAVH